MQLLHKELKVIAVIVNVSVSKPQSEEWSQMRDDQACALSIYSKYADRLTQTQVPRGILGWYRQDVSLTTVNAGVKFILRIKFQPPPPRRASMKFVMSSQWTEKLHKVPLQSSLTTFLYVECTLKRDIFRFLCACPCSWPFVVLFSGKTTSQNLLESPKRHYH